MKMKFTLADVGPVPGADAAAEPSSGLSEILMVKPFLDAATCQGIVDHLARASLEIDLGVRSVRPRSWDPVIQLKEIRPDAMLALGARCVPGFKLLLPLLDDETRRRAPRVRALGDIDARLNVQVLRAFNLLVDDPALYNRCLGEIDGFPGARVARERDGLQSLGALPLRDGRIEAPSALGGLQRQLLKWLNVTILEELFPGALAKENRLVPSDIDAAHLSQALARPVHAGDAELPAFLDVLADPGARELLASGCGLAIDAALWRVFEDPVRRSAVLAGYLAPVRAALAAGHLDRDQALGQWVRAMSDDAATDDLVRIQMLVDALHGIAGPPNAGLVDKVHRNCQTVDWSGVSEQIKQALVRFIREHVEPFYGTTVLEAASVDILKYKQGGFQMIHSDSHSPRYEDGDVAWKRAVERDISILVYLSSSADFTGGQLWFPEQGIKFEPSQGMALAFPSDHRYPHAVREIESGHRYAVVGWLRSLPFGSR